MPLVSNGTYENHNSVSKPHENGFHGGLVDSININGHIYNRAGSAHSRPPLFGKVALITGSGRGIGKGIALELAARGASVVINYANSASSAQAACQEISKLGSTAIALQADVSKPAEVARLFHEAITQLGRLDIVISNSGTESWSNEEDVTPEDFDRIFNLNSRAQFFVAQQALKYLPRGGRIILMSSIAAQMTGVANHALYAGSKSSIEGFARSFAVDAGPKGITVNAIAPGGIKSDMFDSNAWHYAPGGKEGMPIEEIEKGIAAACPLGRIGTPRDIGRAVSLLVNDDSEWINGQVIRLSGGGI